MEGRALELLDAALSYARRGWRVFPLFNPDTTGHCACRHNPRPGGCECGTPDCKRLCSSPAKHPRTLHGLQDATTDEEQIRKWWTMWPCSNIGIRTGSESNLFVLDVDEKHEGDLSLHALVQQFGGLPQTVVGLTGGGEHYYFQHPGFYIKPTASVIAPGLDPRADNAYVVASPSLHVTGRLYAWEGSGHPDEVQVAPAPPWLQNLLRASSTGRPNGNGEHSTAAPVPDRIPEGSRDQVLTSMAGTMRRRGFSAESILAALSVENDRRCVPPKDPTEIKRIAYSVARYTPGDPAIPGELVQGEVPLEDGTVEADWPKLPEKALHGLAGDVVRAFEGHTEADPAAILAHYLVCFGNCVGPSPHFLVGGDEHPAKLFAALVGDSSTGRKGTSEGHVRHLFKGVDPDWVKHCFVQGLASGEGLIRALAPDKEKGASADPRALVVEPEMATVLAAMSRQNSTLSSTIRNAWDKSDLSIVRAQSKNTIKVHGVHVSIVTSITPGELLRRLDSSENSNGFANRFLWFLVRGGAPIADLEPVPPGVYTELTNRTIAALDFGRRSSQIQRDEPAAELWRALYPRLREKRRGLVGLVTNRAAAQVLRLSLVYALLDSSPQVQPVHLEGADALMSFTIECARRIFGGRVGDPVAQRILEVLEDGELSRSDLYQYLGRNLPGIAIENALTQLQGDGLIRIRKGEKPPGAPGPKPQFIALSEN